MRGSGLPDARNSRDLGVNRRRWGSNRWSNPCLDEITVHVGSPLTPRRHLAILLAMALSEHLSLADVKNRLSEVVDSLEREHGRVVVTKHGRPAVVMMNVDDLESLEETLEILSSPALMDSIRSGEDDVVERRTKRLTRDEMLARVAKE